MTKCVGGESLAGPVGLADLDRVRIDEAGLARDRPARRLRS